MPCGRRLTVAHDPIDFSNAMSVPSQHPPRPDTPRRPSARASRSAPGRRSFCRLWRSPAASAPTSPAPTWFPRRRRRPARPPSRRQPSAPGTSAAQAEEPVRIRADLTAARGRRADEGARQPVSAGQASTGGAGADADLLQETLAEARSPTPGWDVYVGDSGPSLKTARLALRWTPPEARALPGHPDRSRGRLVRRWPRPFT